jgi:hypothetical protein
MRNARDAHPGCAREGLERDYIGVAVGVKRSGVIEACSRIARTLLAHSQWGLWNRLQTGRARYRFSEVFETCAY